MTNQNTEKPAAGQNASANGFSETSDALFSDKVFAPAEGEKFVVFFLNEKLYAIATREVAEVTPTLPTASLPNTPEWIFGIANLRGEIVTVIDLPEIFEEPDADIAGRSKFVILQSKAFDSLIAFTVERLGEIITLPAEKIEANRDATSPHIFAKTVYKQNVLHLINAEKILNALTA